MEKCIRTGLKNVNLRPLLNKLQNLPSMEELIQPGTVVVTMSIGQWDCLLAAFYNHGATLLELDDDERPVAAYRKPELGLGA